MPKQLLQLHDVDITAKTTGEVSGFCDSVMIINALDEADAREFLNITSPLSRYGLMRGDITLKKSHSPDTFQFGIDYKEKDIENPSDLPGMKINFDTGGSTKHITEALAVKRYGEKDYKNGKKIKVDWDGKVQGIDIPSSFLKFSETKYFKRSSMSFAFLRKLKKMTNKVNISAFRGFEKGEVRFAGASGNWDDDTNIVSVTYNYEVRENEAAVTIDGIKCDPLLGWVYRWIFYKKEADAIGLITKAAEVLDNAVFPVDDLNKLGRAR